MEEIGTALEWIGEVIPIGREVGAMMVGEGCVISWGCACGGEGAKQGRLGNGRGENECGVTAGVADAVVGACEGLEVVGVARTP